LYNGCLYVKENGFKIEFESKKLKGTNNSIGVVSAISGE
jgi:hypothetical protein